MLQLCGDLVPEVSVLFLFLGICTSHYCTKYSKKSFLAGYFCGISNTIKMFFLIVIQKCFIYWQYRSQESERLEFGSASQHKRQNSVFLSARVKNRNQGE